MQGYDSFMGDLQKRAEFFSKVSGYDEVQIMVRVLSATKNNLVVHIDNDTGLRGLETLKGDVNTLWLPDRHVDISHHECYYDEAGKLDGNFLRTAFEDLARLQQVEKHHMTIHKGGDFSNPLYHTAPGYSPELKMYPGTRVLATFDRA